ncbi:MAG: hypothetical protein ACRC6T_15910 [Sarcina sp.]
MKKIKLLGVVASVIAIGTIGFVGCGASEKEEETKYKDKGIYLTQLKEEGAMDTKLSVIDNGKVIELGDSRSRTPMYAASTEEYITLNLIGDENVYSEIYDLESVDNIDEIFNKENEIVATNKKGEKRSLLKTKVERVFGILDGENFYFSETTKDIKILNIESGEITEIAVEFNAEDLLLNIMGVSDNYIAMKIKDKVKAYSLKDKTWVEIGTVSDVVDTLGVYERKQYTDTTISIINTDKEAVYFDMKTGKITKDKIEQASSIIFGTDDTVIYDAQMAGEEFGSKSIYEKKIGKEKVLLLENVDEVKKYGDYLYGTSRKDNKSKIERVNISKKNAPVEVVYEGSDALGTFNMKVSDGGRVVFEIPNQGLFEFKDGQSKLVLEVTGGGNRIFDFDGENLQAVIGKDRQHDRNISAPRGYDIYSNGEKVEENVPFASISSGEVLYKSHDGNMYNLVNGEKQKLDIDITKYESVSNIGREEILEMALYSDGEVEYSEEFNLSTVDGYYKVIDDNGSGAEYMKIDSYGYRANGKDENGNLGITTKKLTMVDENGEDVSLDKAPKDATKLNLLRGYYRDKKLELEKIDDNKIKLEGLVLERVTKAEYQEGISADMENGLYFEFAKWYFGDGSDVTLLEKKEIDGFTYYEVQSNESGVTVHIREDGDIFTYQEKEWFEDKDMRETLKNIERNLETQAR